MDYLDRRWAPLAAPPARRFRPKQHDCRRAPETPAQTQSTLATEQAAGGQSAASQPTKPAAGGRRGDSVAAPHRNPPAAPAAKGRAGEPNPPHPSWGSPATKCWEARKPGSPEATNRPSPKIFLPPQIAPRFGGYENLVGLSPHTRGDALAPPVGKRKSTGAARLARDGKPPGPNASRSAQTGAPGATQTKAADTAGQARDRRRTSTMKIFRLPTACECACQSSSPLDSECSVSHCAAAKSPRAWAVA